MSTASARQSRDERLAAKLRENLRRRKDQARALSDSEDENLPSRLREGPGEGV